MRDDRRGRRNRPRCRPGRPRHPTRRSRRARPHPDAPGGDPSGPSRPAPAPQRPQRPLASHPGDALGRLRNSPSDEEDPPEQTVTTTFMPHAFKTTPEQPFGSACVMRAQRDGIRLRSILAIPPRTMRSEVTSPNRLPRGRGRRSRFSSLRGRGNDSPGWVGSPLDAGADVKQRPDDSPESRGSDGEAGLRRRGGPHTGRHRSTPPGRASDGRRAGAGPRSRLPVRGRRDLHDRGGHGRERRGPAPRPSAAAPGPSRHGGSAGIRTQGGYEPHRLSRSAPSAARTRYLRR